MENRNKWLTRPNMPLVKKSPPKKKTALSVQQDITLLSEIGQKIISSLSVEVVVDTVYENVNALMDATGFGIGLFGKDEKTLVFPAYIENKEKSRDIIYDLKDKDRLAVWCFNHKKEIFINDFKNEFTNYVSRLQTPKFGKHVESLIYLPLTSKGKAIGVITVQSFKKNAYSEYHLNILRNLAMYAAIALENASLYNEMEQEVLKRSAEAISQKEEIERTYKNQQLLGEIGKQITSTLDFNVIFTKLYENVNKLMDAACFGVRIYHPEKNEVEYKFEIENGHRYESILISMSDDNNFTVWCVKNKKEIFINDNEKEYKKYVKEMRIVSGEMPHSLLFTPMMVGEKLVGAITVQSFEKNVYTAYHLNILRTLATYTAIALENASLYESMLERTAQVEKNYNDTHLLGRIAKDISSSLSVETVISQVYENVNSLMDAACFGIGIYDGKKDLVFRGFVEKGEILPDFTFDSTDENRLAPWCFNNKKEISISDYTTEYSKYIKTTKPPVAGKDSSSIIYLPLYSKEKTVGVITVQSFEKNAFSDYHLDILKNLAVSIGIALDNANLYQNLEEKVKERTTEVIHQKEIIEQKNKEITDSINYAKQIQSSILPLAKDIYELLPDSFGFYKPKDVVSGDFYWIGKQNGKVLVAAADCTGHGVPGAVMSMLGSNKLDHAVYDKGITRPSEILKMLNVGIKSTLKQNRTDSLRDGMDIALMCIDYENKKIEFAGANRPLYHIRRGMLCEMPPTKSAIGGLTLDEQQFTHEEIEIDKGDCIYIFTDGYADQFGGEKGKKMMTKNFRELLITIHSKPMKEQEQILEESFYKWKGNFEQVDDILVIGIRI